MTQKTSQGAAESAAPTATEIAWAAGLFDGEGCFTGRRRNGRYDAHAIVRMQDRESIDRLAAIAPAGRTCTLGTQGGDVSGYMRETYQWTLSRKADLVAFIDRLAPYLGSEKLVKAMNVMAADTRKEPS